METQVDGDQGQGFSREFLGELEMHLNLRPLHEAPAPTVSPWWWYSFTSHNIGADKPFLLFLKQGTRRYASYGAAEGQERYQGRAC